MRNQPHEIRNSHYCGPGTITAIFSIDGYEEVIPTLFRGKSPKPNTFRINWRQDDFVADDYDPATKINDPALNLRTIFGRYLNEDGLPTVDSEDGFVLSPRISPRRLQGLVFTGDEGQTSDVDRPPLRPSTPQEMQERANEIISVMLDVYRDQPELLIPVYDANGNLYWPKKMDYEAVKQLADDRK